MNSPARFRPQRPRHAFTLLELMVVIAIIAIMAALIVPAFKSLKGADDITSAAFTITGVLQQARNYALANNTYTWVGFFEEDASQSSTSPATNGAGRLVLAIVASKDGTTAYDPTSPTNPDPIVPSKLSQVGKLTKIDNVHVPVFNDGTGTGDSFDTRPLPGTTYDVACQCTSTRSARFGDINLPVPQSAPSTNSKFPFHYPLSATFPGQYRFDKTLQFSPKGVATINSTYSVLRAVEIGLVATHANVAPTPTPTAGSYAGNVVALQLAGMSGAVKIYRR